MKRAAIRANAMIRLERELEMRKSEWRPVPVRLAQGLPGRVVTQSALACHRKLAAAVISLALNLAGVRVR